MATDNVIVIVGNLVDDPELRFTQGGHAVANMRVAVNRRMRNNQTNEWEDRLDGYFTVTVWRDQAENVAESLHRGDRVLVTGRLTSRSYEDKEGQTRWVTEIEADEVCPSLRWARVQINKVRGGSGGGGGQQGGQGGGFGGGNQQGGGQQGGGQQPGNAQGGFGGGQSAPTPPEPEDVPF